MPARMISRLAAACDAAGRWPPTGRPARACAPYRVDERALPRDGGNMGAAA